MISTRPQCSHRSYLKVQADQGFGNKEVFKVSKFTGSALMRSVVFRHVCETLSAESETQNWMRSTSSCRSVRWKRNHLSTIMPDTEPWMIIPWTSGKHCDREADVHSSKNFRLNSLWAGPLCALDRPIPFHNIIAIYVAFFKKDLISPAISGMIRYNPDRRLLKTWS